MFDQCQNLTGRIAYKIFDRLPVKYPVPYIILNVLFRNYNYTDSDNSNSYITVGLR